MNKKRLRLHWLAPGGVFHPPRGIPAECVSGLIILALIGFVPTAVAVDGDIPPLDRAAPISPFQARLAREGRIASFVWVADHVPDPSLQGEPVVVSYRVISADPAVPSVPTGTVRVQSAGGETCQSGLDGQGMGSCTLALSTLGEVELSATYQGDGVFVASQSTSVVHTVCDPLDLLAVDALACDLFPREILFQDGFE